MLEQRHFVLFKVLGTKLFDDPVQQRHRPLSFEDPLRSLSVRQTGSVQMFAAFEILGERLHSATALNGVIPIAFIQQKSLKNCQKESPEATSFRVGRFQKLLFKEQLM